MNVANIVQGVLVSKKNPTVDDLLDYHLTKPDFSKSKVEYDDLPF